MWLQLRLGRLTVARATDAAHLSDSPSAHSHFSPPLQLFWALIRNMRYSFNVDEGRQKGWTEWRSVAAVFGFMTTSSGIQMTTECVITLYKCVYLFFWVIACLISCIFFHSVGIFILMDIKKVASHKTAFLNLNIRSQHWCVIVKIRRIIVTTWR